MVQMVNFFEVDGYQFDFSIYPGIVDVIAAIDGTFLMTGGQGGLTAQVGNGVVIGFDMGGTETLLPSLEGQLLAVLVVSPYYTGSGSELEVTISDFVVSGINPFTGECVVLNACDTDLNPLNGCFSQSTFLTPTADCAGIPDGKSTNDETVSYTHLTLKTRDQV